MTAPHISFIGGGNMARSLIAGLVANGFKPANITVSDPDEKQRQLLTEKFAVHGQTDNQQALAGADAVVLAVKPQQLRDVAGSLAANMPTPCPLFISIAAGIRSNDLHRWLGGQCPVIRSMPNTPAMVRSGVTGLFARPGVSDSQRNLAESILRAVGSTVWVEQESELDAVTAVSGSGPAYFFYVMEVMELAARELGLSADAAHLLTIETAFGAAKLALESHEDPAQLRRQVTSPGGTTEQALAVLEQGGLAQLFNDALQAARLRAAELSEELGDN
jgi:pyrroline-5-carboxylate reductase